ncbi:MAG: epoxyqueuosine reductase QueH [Alphaproteobacteria bacterium]|nr:epoxyqueuosine reductase QueH [Alphaproteobacteria bacterium]
MSERAKLKFPIEAGKILLHCCCAPCSGDVVERLCENGADFAIYFYNPNVHPREEYEKRKAAIVSYAQKMNVPFVDADYDPDRWFERVKGREAEPERGKRCDICFSMRLERSALYAHENGYPVLASSFGISRWKNIDQVNACGRKAAAAYADVMFWDYNWRKQGGSERMIQIAEREKFYRQTYCGCAYSLRDTGTRNNQESR